MTWHPVVTTGPPQMCRKINSLRDAIFERSLKKGGWNSRRGGKNGFWGVNFLKIVQIGESSSLRTLTRQFLVFWPALGNNQYQVSSWSKICIIYIMHEDEKRWPSPSDPTSQESMSNGDRGRPQEDFKVFYITTSIRQCLFVKNGMNTKKRSLKSFPR